MNLLAMEYIDKSKAFFFDRIGPKKCPTCCGYSKDKNHVARIRLTGWKNTDKDGNPCQPYVYTSDTFDMTGGQLFALYRHIGDELQRMVDSENN